MGDLGQTMAEVLGINPGLRQGAPPPPPSPAAAIRPCTAERVLAAGGDVVQRLMHPNFVPFEQLFRKLPNEGVFTATPQKNFRFTLGTFRVPESMGLLLVDYRFDIYRLNGAVPGDFRPIEPRRLSTQIGYDVNIDQFRKGNINYQLEPSQITSEEATVVDAPRPGIDASSPFGPIPSQIGNPDFPVGNPPLGATASDFARARAANASSPSGVGSATLPQRTERQGPLPLPWTMIVKPSYRLQFDVIAFRPVPIPIGFFEVGFTGLLMPYNELAAIMESVAPCTTPGAAK